MSSIGFPVAPPDAPAGCATLIDVLRFRGLEQAANDAFIAPCDDPDQARAITNGGLERWARRFAAHLQSRGARGQRVVLLFNTGLEYIAAYFGVLMAGAVAVPTYPLMRPNRRKFLLRLIQDARPVIILAEREIHDAGVQAFKDEPSIANVRWIAADELDEGCEELWTDPGVGPDDVGMLQYTSGSTGHPKGVMVTHANLIGQTASIYHWLERPPTTPGQTFLPLYHDMGLIGAILYPFYAGFPVGVMSPLSFVQRPVRWLETISALRATISGGPNFAYDLCVDKVSDAEIERLDLSCWRYAFMGSEPIRAETLDRFSERFARCGFRREHLFPAYGCAESTIMIVGRPAAERGPVVRVFDGRELPKGRAVDAAPDSEDARPMVSSGEALAGHVLKIVDPETREVLPQRRIGEIWAQGNGVASGYFDKPQATDDTFAATTADGEGPFLRTGDLGFLLGSKLFITSRLKDLIIVAGKNHHPPDIEESVEDAHPALQSCGAIVFSADIEGAERVVVVAEVRRRLKVSLGEPTDPPVNGALRAWQVVGEEEIVTAVRRVVSRDHDLALHEVLLLRPNSIPKTTSGKLARAAARQAYLDGTLRPARSEAP